MKLPHTVAALGRDDFLETLKKEIEALDPNELPLQESLQHSSMVSPSKHQAVILSTEENETSIRAKVSIFYTGIIAGCSCADDPSPTDEVQECCEMELFIEKKTSITIAHQT